MLKAINNSVDMCSVKLNRNSDFKSFHFRDFSSKNLIGIINLRSFKRINCSIGSFNLRRIRFYNVQIE